MKKIELYVKEVKDVIDQFTRQRLDATKENDRKERQAVIAFETVYNQVEEDECSFLVRAIVDFYATFACCQELGIKEDLRDKSGVDLKEIKEQAIKAALKNSEDEIRRALHECFGFGLFNKHTPILRKLFRKPEFIAFVIDQKRHEEWMRDNEGYVKRYFPIC